MWFALFWPALAIIILAAIPEFRRRMVPWEYALPWAPCLIMIPMAFTIGEAIQVRDYERWGGHATEVRYYEDWNEYIHRTCTRTVGSGKNQRTETYDCSYVDYHPEYWELISTVGTFRLSESEYNAFVARWGGKETFVDMHRWYHTDDGDMYKAVWDQQEKTLEPAFITQTYENRTQAAHSVYEWLPIDPEETPVYEWPGTSRWESQHIFGPHATPALDTRLARLNSKFGPQHECQVLICTWIDAPIQVGFDQQHYWKGGNKNELVITLSTDKNNRPQWAHVFSWMDNQFLSYQLRDRILDQETLNLDEFLDALPAELWFNWHRKEFGADAEDGGFSMIQVDPPTWMYWTLHILSILASAGVAAFVVMNEQNDDSTGRPHWYPARFRRR